jgi:hypothetical protein
VEDEGGLLLINVAIITKRVNKQTAGKGMVVKNRKLE